jgi:pyruvate/2-oxoglutarate/acetoin dehydrogenase E1 component
MKLGLRTPGLKSDLPAFPYDAKGLLATAINDQIGFIFLT